MALAVDGIVSGLDTSSLIKAVLTARSVSIDTLRSRLGGLEKQRDAVAGISNRMSALSEKIAAIGTPEGLLAHTAATASSSFTVSAGPKATSGSWSLRVHSLAAAQVAESQGVDDPGAETLATGTLTVTVGGVATEVTVDSGDNSLRGLAAALNEVDGLTAWVVDTGAPTGRYRLVVQGEDTGEANAFTLDTSGLGGGTLPTFTDRVAAADASVEVSGIAIRSASNRLVDVVPGLTVDLRAENGVAEGFTVQRDDATVRERFQGVLDAYNQLLAYQRTQSVFDAEAGLKGPLSGEVTTRRAVEELSTMLTREYPVGGTPLTALAELGVSTGRDGSLQLDAAAFDAALAADPDGLVALLTSDAGPLAAMAQRIDDTFVEQDTGTLATRSETLVGSIEEMKLQIEKAEERLVVHADILRSQFTAMEIVLSRLQTTQGFVTNLINSAPKMGSSKS